MITFQSWDVFFRNADNGAPPGMAYQSPPEIYGHPIQYQTEVTVAQPQAAAPAQSAPADFQDHIQDHLAVFSLIRAYQVLKLFNFMLIDNINFIGPSIL